MKKTVKILAIVLLSIMMLFVTVQPVSYARDASEIINEATKEPTDKKADTSGLNNVAQNVINIIWIISIIVANNGSKIPEDIQQKIFTDGFTTKNTGSGIGLYVCRQTLEEQFARLELLKSDDKSTEFEILISMV